jgi:hypothetical protein
MQIANKYMKQCSTSSAIKEMQIKIIPRFHFTIRMAFIKKTNSNKCWQGYREKEPSNTVGRNVN